MGIVDRAGAGEIYNVCTWGLGGGVFFIEKLRGLKLPFYFGIETT
jgi:hypothetical protein